MIRRRLGRRSGPRCDWLKLAVRHEATVLVAILNEWL
jgi:hypothetical protein